jgi:hypothetical protein
MSTFLKGDFSEVMSNYSSGRKTLIGLGLGLELDLRELELGIRVELELWFRNEVILGGKVMFREIKLDFDCSRNMIYGTFISCVQSG